MNAAEQLQTLAAEIRAKAAPAAHQLDSAATVLDQLFDQAAAASESPAFVVLLYGSRIMQQASETLLEVVDLALQVDALARAKQEIAASSPEFLDALHAAAELLDAQLRQQAKATTEVVDVAWMKEGKR